MEKGKIFKIRSFMNPFRTLYPFNSRGLRLKFSYPKGLDRSGLKRNN